MANMYLTIIKNYVLLFHDSLDHVKFLLCYIDAAYEQDVHKWKSTIEFVITLDDDCIS